MGNYLTERRKELGLTMKQVADAVGVSEGTVSRWESGAIANMRRDRIRDLAKVLQVRPTFIMTGEMEEPQKVQELPAGIRPAMKKRYKYLGEIACGEPIFADEQVETYIDLESDINADFVLKAKGDSMINARINNGDLVFIREQSDVDDGEIAAVIIDDEATLKRVYKYDDHIALYAENPSYKPIQVRSTDAMNVRIIGKAIAATIFLK